MKWYQTKEQAAGAKRLMLLWYLYNIFGKRTVRLVVIFVALFAFVLARQVRYYSQKNLEVIYKFTQKKSAFPSVFNCYRLVLNYAWSLVDKMEAFANKFPVTKLVFDSDVPKRHMECDIENKKGIIFICSHIGNVEVLRTFVQQPQWSVNPCVNVFLSKEQCKIFNAFLKQIEVFANIKTYPVEDIGMDTAIEIDEKLNNGEVVFIAGDRVSSGFGSDCDKVDFLGQKCDFPQGTFRFAQMFDVSIYFISAIKSVNDEYLVYMEKFEKDLSLSKQQNYILMQKKYCNFLEKLVKIAPLQFYHFYRFFD